MLERQRGGEMTADEARKEVLLDQYRRPRHRGSLKGADVEMPGGNPGCGDVVTIYLNTKEDRKQVEDASFEGRGCIISQAAADIILERVHRERLTTDQILGLDYETLVDELGRGVLALGRGAPRSAWGC